MSLGLFITGMGIFTAVVMSGIGSAIGIGIAAQVAAGALTEDPKKFGKFLMLVALPGTQGIYGFVIGFLTIMKLGIIGGAVPDVSLVEGLVAFAACAPVGIAGLVSAIHQGKVTAAGIEMTSKQPNEGGKALVMGVFVELYAVLGLLISFFLVWFAVKF
ncbi:MAG: V-type ATP synthase subunit K [bacterium]|nr:V-type ATP synthase subunit K [bacterium]